MSKIAEQKALRVYPELQKENFKDWDDFMDASFERMLHRIGFIQGYDQAMKDFLKDAIDFFYMQINCGDMEVKNIKIFIEQFVEYIKKEN